MLNLYEFQQYCKDHTIEEISEHYGKPKNLILSQISRMEKAGIPTPFIRVRSTVKTRDIWNTMQDKFSEEAKKYTPEQLKDPEIAKQVWKTVSDYTCEKYGMTPAEINRRTRDYKRQLINGRKFDKRYIKQLEKEKTLEEKKEVFGDNVRPKKGGNGPVHGTFENPRRLLPDLSGVQLSDRAD